MDRRVSTHKDLTAGSGEFLSPRRTEWRPESAVADLWRAVGWDLLGTGPEVPGTRKLFPAEERSESSEHLETERPSAWLEGPSWTVETRTGGVSLEARGRPCRTAGDYHQATSDRTHWGTLILSDQLPVLWHQAVATHHWTGWRRSPPRGTTVAMNTTMPSNLYRSQAVMMGLVIQCWWTDWTFETHLWQGRHCELSNVELHPYELEVLSDFSKLMIQPKILEQTDGHLGMQLGLFWSICTDQPVV